MPDLPVADAIVYGCCAEHVHLWEHGTNRQTPSLYESGRHVDDASTGSKEVKYQGDPAHFPVLAERIYLNHAAVSPLPACVAGAMTTYLGKACRTALAKSFYDEAGAGRASAARLIGASSPSEIAFTPNTSTGLSLVAGGLDWREGDTIVTTSIEFPANRYVWEELQRLGVRVIQVTPDSTQRVRIDDLVKAVRASFQPGKTNLLTVSHVQYATGQKLDAAALADVAHSCGGLLCLDAIQSIGAMPVDVDTDGVDFLSADGHKWMLGPEGCGIFYCRQKHLERMRPLVAGWLSMEDAFAPLHGAEPRIKYRSDARRFEPGCWNVVGMIGLAAALRMLLDVGTENVWQSVRTLTSHIEQGARSLGCSVMSPSSCDGDPDASGIVMLQLPPGSAESQEQIATIVSRLADRGIDVVDRVGAIRISPHFYNTTQQMDRVITALKEVLAAPA